MFFEIFLLAQSTFAQTTEVYMGEAVKDGRLVYRERHEVKFDKDGKVLEAQTRYLSPDGKLKATLDSKFDQSLTYPAHTFEDLRTGHKHGLRLEEGKIVMFSQDKGQQEKTKVLDPKTKEGKLIVGGQGLHYYLLANFDKEKDKKKKPLVFLIPGRLDYYNFNLQFIKEDGPISFYEVEITNLILRMFAPKLKMKYDTKNKHLLEYEGLSNLHDENNKTQSVKITYQFGQDAIIK